MASQWITQATPEVNEIQSLIQQEYGITWEQLRNGRRFNDLVLPRHVFFWLMRKLTQHSWAYIGGCCKVDHSSAIHGVQAIEDRRDTDAKFRIRTDELLIAAHNRMNNIIHQPFDIHNNIGAAFL